MFERPRPKSAMPGKKALEGLTPILPIVQLITKGKRQEHIEQIAKTSHFEPLRFNTLCQSLIHNLLNYTQQLPETTNSYFSNPGGLFDHALSRTKAATELFQQFILEDPSAKLSEEQQLWWYALFSAGLLRGIGKLPLDFYVTLHGREGNLIKTWEPLLESLAHDAHAYHFEYENSNQDDDFRRRLNIILAQQLMPREGFAWLSKHLDVFAVWLALLHEDSASSGTLALILDRADDIAIQEDILNFEPDPSRFHEASNRRIGTFIDAPEESLGDRERLAGAEFIQWLREKLESGKITFNKHPLYHVPAGTLIGPDALKLFIREHPEFKNWLAIRHGVMALGLHQKLPDNASSSENLTLKGSVALPDTLDNTLVLDVLSKNDRKQLASDGTWHAIEKQNAHLKPKRGPLD
jgi:integrating conjugative element relaxase (TIGR03760 family)